MVGALIKDVWIRVVLSIITFNNETSHVIGVHLNVFDSSPTTNYHQIVCITLTTCAKTRWITPSRLKVIWWWGEGYETLCILSLYINLTMNKLFFT